MNWKRLSVAALIAAGFAFAGAGGALAHDKDRMGQGMGEGMSQGMMGCEAMEHGKRHGKRHDMMRHRKHHGMGQGMQGHGMGHGGKQGAMGGFQRLLSADKVTEKLQRWIEHHGSTRLTVGTVEEGGDFTIRAEITTVDGSLVSRLLVDRRDGSIWQID